jgi:hypothetical protein
MGIYRQHRVTIYQLKRLWGKVVRYYTPTSNTHDVLTGAISRTYDLTIIRKAIVCPSVLDRSFVYDLAFIASSKNFTGGAYFDRNLRGIILDASDLPKGFIPKINHHLEFEDDRFEIKSIEKHLDNSIYVIECQSLSNAGQVG